MEILLVRDKQGNERPMTKAVYDLIGYKRKPEIIGKAKDTRPLSEMDKIKADLIAKKAAGLPLTTEPVEKISELPQSSVSADEVVIVDKPRRGPKPKSKE